MDATYAVLGLAIFLGLVLCINAQGNTTICSLACPGDEVLNETICKCVSESLLADHIPFQCPQVKCSPELWPCLSYKRDDRGCITCECLYNCPVRRCHPNCKKNLEYFTDKYGCDSCRCRLPLFCPGTKCDLFCLNGYQTNSKGCKICKCTPCGDLCNINCLHGKLVDFNGCEICACKPESECGPVCPMKCPYGILLDGNTCPTCQCLPQPQ